MSGRLNWRPPEVLFVPSFCDFVKPTMELELCVWQTLEMGRCQQMLYKREFAVITLTTSSRWFQRVVQKSGISDNSGSLNLDLKQKVFVIRQGSVLSDRVLTV